MFEQEFPSAKGLMVLTLTEVVGTNMKADEIQLVTLAVREHRIGVGQVDLAGTQGFDLGSHQGNTGFEPLKNLIFKKGLTVRDNGSYGAIAGHQ
jgi:hypothetical protein